jgi:hypothetical protein
MDEQQVIKDTILSVFPEDAAAVTDEQLSQIISSPPALEAPPRDRDPF